MGRFAIGDQVRSDNHPGLWGTVVDVLPATVKVRWFIPNATNDGSTASIEESDPASLVTAQEINERESRPPTKSDPLY